MVNIVLDVRITRLGLEKELATVRDSYIDVDIMCDAYKKELHDRNFNQNNRIKENCLVEILKYFDTLDTDEMKELKECMRPYYKAYDTTSENKSHLLVRRVGCNVQLIFKYKEGGLTKSLIRYDKPLEVAKKELKYILGTDSRPKKEYDYVAIVYLNSLVKKIKTKRGVV